MLAALISAAPAAASDVELFSAETLKLSGDLRFSLADGEKSWVDGGFGKLRSSGDGDGELRAKPEIGAVDLVWEPRVGFNWSARVVASFQGGERSEAGISEAFIAYKPMQRDGLRVGARAGLMWPPVSLEHGGSDWHVLDTLTPSAINSWIGEEVRPLAIEGSVTLALGQHELAGSLAAMAANDTAGTLLTFRGWALHDRRTIDLRHQPLPPLPEAVEYYQPRFTHPLLDVEPGFANRPGYYAKLAWQPPIPVRVELFRYDNRADPEAVNEDLEWGWRTQFNHVGVAGRLGKATEFKVQAMDGRTRMGIVENGKIWIDARFRSAFALASHSFGKAKLAARIEAFGVRQKGGLIDEEYDEQGWAGTFALTRQLAPSVHGILEVVHVSSRREDRRDVGLAPRQHQTMLQAAIRFSW